MNRAGIAVSGDTAYDNPSAIVGRVVAAPLAISHGGSWSQCIICESLKLSMNRLRSAAVSKTSRSASQRSGLLRLVPLCPAHSRAPYADRFMIPMHAKKIERGFPRTGYIRHSMFSVRCSMFDVWWYLLSSILYPRPTALHTPKRLRHRFQVPFKREPAQKTLP
jgi:hypothetical protein